MRRGKTGSTGTKSKVWRHRTACLHEEQNQRTKHANDFSVIFRHDSAHRIMLFNKERITTPPAFIATKTRVAD